MLLDFMMLPNAFSFYDLDKSTVPEQEEFR